MSLAAAAAAAEMVVVVDGVQVVHQNENWKWVQKLTLGSQLDMVIQNVQVVGY